MQLKGEALSGRHSGNDEIILPFLKWAGGKRWFTSISGEYFPKTFNRYIEPFLGSGAVFFSLKPSKAILSDINADLIETFTAVKDDWEGVIDGLAHHHKNHSREYYYRVRSSVPTSRTARATRLIYLNRTCWNGLYRVNLKGEFNVPIGTKTSVVLDTDNFKSISNLLQNVEIVCSDFEEIIDKAAKNDLLFIDPPYTVKHNYNGFVKYNEKIFSWDDQVRLRDVLCRARERGAHILLTNANHKSVKRLYRLFGKVVEQVRPSVIAADSSNRGTYTELLIQALSE